MSQRDARVGADADGGSDAGDNFEAHSGLGQGFGLFSAAAEDVRIAALETDDALAGPSRLDQHAMNFFL